MQPLRCSWAAEAGLQLLIRRDDQIDALQSGNKLYKLFYNLEAAQAAGAQAICSAGGAWSNHLYALAAASQQLGVASKALVRGEAGVPPSASLQDAAHWGMQLHFTRRSEYPQLSRAGLPEWQSRAYYWVPEGGANLLGAAGMYVAGWAIEQQLPSHVQVCMAVGTGTSLAGLAAGAPTRQVLGFSVLKGEGALARDIQGFYRQLRAAQYSGERDNWALISGFHGGGYGRKPKGALLQFWQAFERETGLLLDPVYTLKLCWGVAQLAKRGYWPRGTTLLLVHSGGLQGRRGFICPAP